jgi:anti-sigma B factor antagonist
MAQGHNIEVEIYSEAASIVALRGEHDLHSAPDVAAALAVAAESPNILVDLTGSTFIDSSVIGAILRADAAARSRHADLGVVVGAAAAVARALELAGVASILRVHDSRELWIAGVESGDERRQPLHLWTVSAKIKHLDAQTAARRTEAKAANAGFAVIRRPVDPAPELRHAA